MAAYGEMLKSLIAQKGYGLREFAQRVGYAHSNISAIMAGRRPPPLDRIERWADALGLDGQERQEFLEEAYLAHAPQQVRHIVDRMRVEIDSLEAMQIDQMGRITRLVADGSEADQFCAEPPADRASAPAQPDAVEGGQYGPSKKRRRKQ